MKNNHEFDFLVDMLGSEDAAKAILRGRKK